MIEEGGVSGLMFRGLETKIMLNGLQGILFSILWQHFEEVLFPDHEYTLFVMCVWNMEC